MDFPVDVLDATRHVELEALAHSHMNKLLYSNPDHAEHFTLPSGKKVEISLSTVGFVPLYGADEQHKVLALFSPHDQSTAVALFLNDGWYAAEDILRTADPTREGLLEVRSVGERIVLYVLNRIVYRAREMSSGEVPFLCHGAKHCAKILWKDGEAVGFYSVKSKGSVLNNSLKQCYLLPVMDSIFVRKAHRGNNHGLQMLEDFVDSFAENELGVKYPLSPAMANVCRRYLTRYPADVDLLWEVQGIGGPYQRTRLATKLASPLFIGDSGCTEDAGQNGTLVDDKLDSAEEASLDITEGVVIVRKSYEATDETSTPVFSDQSGDYKRRKRLRDETETDDEESRPQKINRVEKAEEDEDDSVVPDQTLNKSVAIGMVQDLAQDHLDNLNSPTGEKLDDATTEEQDLELDPIADVQSSADEEAVDDVENPAAKLNKSIVQITKNWSETASSASEDQEEPEVLLEAEEKFETTPVIEDQQKLACEEMTREPELLLMGPSDDESSDLEEFRTTDPVMEEQEREEESSEDANVSSTALKEIPEGCEKEDMEADVSPEKDYTIMDTTKVAYEERSNAALEQERRASTEEQHDSRRLEEEKEDRKNEDDYSMKVLQGTRTEVSSEQASQEPMDDQEERKMIADEDEDPSLMDRRMLRGKRIQVTSRSRAKRRGRM